MDDVLKLHTLVVLDSIADSKRQSLKIQLMVAVIIISLAKLIESARLPIHFPIRQVLISLVLVMSLEHLKASQQEKTRLEILDSAVQIERLLLSRYWTSHMQIPRLLPARDIFHWILSCHTTQFYRLVSLVLVYSP